MTIVGVAGDSRNRALDAAPEPSMYIPYQYFTLPFMSVMARSAGGTGAVASAVRAEVRALDPDMPIDEARSLNEIVRDSVAEPRFRMLVLGTFAVTALLLAAVGVYGLISYSVAQRTREIGIRVALGARPAQVGLSIVREGLTLAVIGIAVGLGAQTLVKDWLAGIFIVLENQYNQGDVIRIAGVDGVVEDFSLRRTTLRDLDGTVHTVPNGQITVTSNMTRLWARVNLDVSVAYDTDIDRATRIIDEVGEKIQADPDWEGRVLEPPHVVRVNALGDSSVTLKVLGQVKAAEQWAVGGELRKRILDAFGKAGIEIPFPHRVVVSRSGGADADAEAAAAAD